VIGQVMILGVAAVLLLMGAITLARAGLDGDMAVPVVSVLGFTHTAWLGFLELAFGLLLLLGGLSPAVRDLGLAMGIVTLLAGILIVIEPSAPPAELAIERSYGWLLIVLGAVAAVGGLLPGGRVRRWRRADATYV
jgi:hypothetical protein